MFSLISFIQRVNKGNNPPAVDKSAKPLRFGLLGAARIAPDAVLKPAKNHSDVIVVAVAARDKDRAIEFSHKWGIERAYGGPNGYQDLIQDDTIDVVYNGLPNALHLEWTMKALSAGKHVLCEKPIADNEEETRRMYAKAEEKNVVLLEAWQPRFHPAIQRAKDIVDEGSLGQIKAMTCDLGVWDKLFFLKDDIRFKYELGGGCLMDMGPYPISVMRYIAGSNPRVESASAVHRGDLEKIDKYVDADLTFPSGVKANIILNAALEGWGPFKLIPRLINALIRVECEHGVVEIRNFVLPHVWHSLTVIPADGRQWVEKAYKPKTGKGEEWWTAYRFQLEALVDKIRGREPEAWRTAEDSIDQMRIIDAIYTKAGFPLRPTSTAQV